MKTIIEPFRIKVVEPLTIRTRAEREALIRKAGFNLFLLHADDVLIDLLTDSGTGAMSSLQWAGVMRADESYAGSPSFYRFEQVVQDITGFRHVLPTHQGRAAERILFDLVGAPGKTVPSNGHFDTTRANIEHSGAAALDLPIAEARDPRKRHPFKGNIDVAALRAAITRVSPENVPVVMMTVTSNSYGGQPASLANLREVRAVCDEFGLPLFLDAARFAENAWFIKLREPGEQDRPVRAIVRRLFDLADGALISAKKDGLSNTGGVLLIRDEALFQRASNLLILTEGYVTYGGLAGRDLEAMAQGFEEVLDENYLQYRIRTAEYVGERLTAAGVPIIEPPGGHAVYLDAASFCPHLPPARFPGQALAAALYRHAGIRTVEIGSLMFGGEGHPAPPLELVRLALPRRVYTQSHMDYVVEAVIEVFERRQELRGLRIVEAPPVLRHFTARLEEL
jgi:tyrosine phenol-lyase